MVQKEKLKWFCKAVLGKNIDLDNFDEKLIIQKTVYIAQKMGFNFGYNFGWYVRGVYSSSLTVDLYGMDEKTTYNPTSDDISLVKLINSFKKDFNDNGVSAFELISSVVYADKHRHMNEDDITHFIKRVKPWYTDNQIKKAIILLKHFNS